MPKRVTTFAKCDNGIRNPFTHRCIDPTGDTAAELVQLVHHPNEFKHKLKNAKVPKPDRKQIIEQWKYIAGLVDTQPANLPVPLVKFAGSASNPNNESKTRYKHHRTHDTSKNESAQKKAKYHNMHNINNKVIRKPNPNRYIGSYRGKYAVCISRLKKLKNRLLDCKKDIKFHTKLSNHKRDTEPCTKAKTDKLGSILTTTTIKTESKNAKSDTDKRRFYKSLKLTDKLYYGKSGIGNLPVDIKDQVINRISQVLEFHNAPRNSRKMGARLYSIHNMKSLYTPQNAVEYEKMTDVILNANNDIQKEIHRLDIEMSPANIAKAVDTRAKRAIFEFLKFVKDPSLKPSMKEEKEEKEEKKIYKDKTYTNANDVKINEMDPITFIIGAGASRDAGIDTFMEISPATAENLDVMLKKAWKKCPKYSDDDQAEFAEEVGFHGKDIKKFFFGTDNPGKKLRNCMTTMAADKYIPMMLAAWEFIYVSVKDKKPALTHSIIKALEDIEVVENNKVKPILANIITMNVDGLEFAAGIEEISIIPVYGCVLMKQPIGTAFGDARGSWVESIDEIRGGKYRPAMALYGEDILPSTESMENAAKDGEDGTLIIVGTSLSTGSQLLNNFDVKTTIVVNPNRDDVKDTIKILNGATNATAADEDISVESDNDDDEYKEAVHGFSTEKIIAFRKSKDLETLFKRLYKNDFTVSKPTKTTSSAKVSTNIVNRFNEFIDENK